MALGALLVGIGYGPITPAGSDLLKRVTPSRLQPIVFSLKQTAVPAGGAIAGVLVPALVHWHGWRETALIMGGACTILAVLVEPLRPRFDGPKPPAATNSLLGLQSLRLVATNRSYAALGIAGLAYAVVQGVLFTYLVPYLSAKLGMTLVLAGAVMTATQVGGIIGRIVWGFVATWLNSGMRVLIGLGVAMAASAAVTALFSAGWPALAITGVGLAFGMTAVGWNGVFFAEIARVAPLGTIGALTGALSAIAFIGVMLGPPLFGLIVKTARSYDVGFFGIATIAVFGGAVLWLWCKEGNAAI
jgi:predicted MFS family arabinose efflux permease